MPIYPVPLDQKVSPTARQQSLPQELPPQSPGGSSSKQVAQELAAEKLAELAAVCRAARRALPKFQLPAGHPDLVRAIQFSEELASNDAKKQEARMVRDSAQLENRHLTGVLGELAVGYLLGVEVVDWRIGSAKTFHNPDLERATGQRVGVKTSLMVIEDDKLQEGLLPVIFKSSHYPEFICVAKPTDGKSLKNGATVVVIGLATVDVLTQYQTLDGLASPALKAKGSKAAFTGLAHVMPSPQNLAELKFMLTELKGQSRSTSMATSQRPQVQRQRSPELAG